MGPSHCYSVQEAGCCRLTWEPSSSPLVPKPPAGQPGSPGCDTEAPCAWSSGPGGAEQWVSSSLAAPSLPGALRADENLVMLESWWGAVNFLQRVHRLQKLVSDTGTTFNWPGCVEVSCPVGDTTAFISSRARGSGASPVLWEEQDPETGRAVAPSSSAGPVTSLSPSFLICQMGMILVEVRLLTCMKNLLFQMLWALTLIYPHNRLFRFSISVKLSGLKCQLIIMCPTSVAWLGSAARSWLEVSHAVVGQGQLELESSEGSTGLGVQGASSLTDPAPWCLSLHGASATRTLPRDLGFSLRGVYSFFCCCCNK